VNAVPQIQATRCVRYRFRYSDCRRCERACPHEAIRLSDEGVAIAGESCRGCGLCVSACRTEAFGTASLAPLGLIEKARGQSSFSIACAACGADADAIVPCLGALGPALLAYLVKQGTELNLAGSGHCASCVHGASGSEQLALNLDALEALRVADAKGLSGTLHAAHSGMSPSGGRAGSWAGIALLDQKRGSADRGDERRAARRQFFRRFATVGETAPHNPRAPPGLAAPLRAIRAARVAPSAQRDLLQMLGLADVQAPLAAHPSLPAGDLRLEPGCTGCEACARACPTGALQVRENAEAWALGFDAGLCVACGVCVETCKPRVLQLREEVAAARFAKRPPVALHGLPKRRCKRCDRSFVTETGSALCDVCAGDEQDFNAIFGCHHDPKTPSVSSPEGISVLLGRPGED